MQLSGELSSKNEGINKYFAFALALLVVPLSGLATDIYVPSLPSITHYFGVDKSFAQLTIAFYMAGLGIAQLFAGIISDSYGRRKPFLLAMTAFIFATFCIPFCHSINQLLFLRLMQGCTVAMVVVPMRSVLNDLFEGAEYLKKSNYMFLSWSLGPIIAPMIGGYTQHYFGWQANFYLLLIYSVISFLAVLFFMPETSRYNYPLDIAKSLRLYKEMITHAEYLRGLIMNCLLYSLIILFAVVGPFLIENILYYSAIQFGHIALLVGLAWFLGGFTNRLLMHVSVCKKTLFAFLLMLIIAVISVFINFIFPINMYLISIPILLVIFLGGVVFPNNFARGTAIFPKNSASANALFGSMVFLIAGIASSLATFLKSESQIPLAVAYMLIIAVGLVVAFIKK